jgi:hypothetical protein
MVRDGAGRTWGTVVMRRSQDSPTGRPEFSGDLIPTPQFDEVRPLFERFNELFRDDTRIEELEAATDALLALNVELVDTNSSIKPVKGIVTIDNDLVLTYCEGFRGFEA